MLGLRLAARLPAAVARAGAVRTFAAEAAAAAAAPEASAADAAAQSPAAALQRRKFKNHFKRASSVIADIDKEAWARMQLKMKDFRPAFPAFEVGDAVEIEYASEHTEKDPVLIRGTVIEKVNKGIDSKFTILNAFDEEWYTATYPFSSPLLRRIRVMMKRRFSQGLKRPHRAKLHALKERDPTQFYFVDHNTREAVEIQAEKERKRALQRSGKVYKKQRGVAKGREEGGKAGGKGGKK